jgi:hypothetical protein
MKRRLPVFFFWFCLPLLTIAQIGGDNVYEFVNLSPSARVTALGGSLITVMDDDVNLAQQNPSLLNPEMHQQLSVNHNFHIADIQYGYASFGWQMKKWDATLHGGVQYLDYGTFLATNEIGEEMGEFDAGEYAVTLGIGKELYERMNVGANLRYVTSQMEGYTSHGLLMDVAGIYKDTARRLNLTLVFRNIGGQVQTYREGNREPVPFEIQAGVSHRLKYLPFRFSVIMHNLQRWNILYDDPNSEEDVLFLGTQQDVSDGNPAIDNFFRHFIFSGEFLLGSKENFRLRAGYNHLLGRELAVTNFRGASGFAFGAGIKINRFRLDYGHGFYHFGGGVNHITISTNLQEFMGNRGVLDIE